MSSDSVSQDFADILAEEIKNEIDREVLSKVLVSQGWHLVEYKKEPNIVELVDIYTWLDSNLTGNHVNLHHSVAFELAEDAVMFKLRWAGK
jgi:hypothetical protein